ncbi:uncharacterized protein K02A2.6-like [Toxorhynchites rutilus septentrionalis]|uniref:uncharacterized protein K02A2.6-like n=1 Tax=Toxorhynchites rutilus septentrionalis TaxID=329112 RepID=UPI0024788A5C|nr:uncharacterized protein K02A2.6-like [Toxorhynchites rutilus septentrionalis]
MRAKMLHLGGTQLQKVFRSLEGTEEFSMVLIEKPWFDVAIERLDAFFKPRKQDVLERHKLRNMKQDVNERFAHFVLRLRQQLMDCGLDKYSNEIRKEIIPVKDESSTDCPGKVYYSFYTGNDTNVIICQLGGIDTERFVVLGPEANLITVKTWDFLKANEINVQECVRGSNRILKAYGSDTPLKMLAFFKTIVKVRSRSVEAEFFVVSGGQRYLLGDTTSKQLGVLKVGHEVNQVMNRDDANMPFSKIVDVRVHIKMNPEITPCSQPLRRIPIPMEVVVNKKLEELLRRDIIEAKKGPATWVSPLVVAKIINGDILLCVDLRRVNQAVIRDRHPMPIIEEILMRIGKGKLWTVLDIKDAFCLLELDDETRDIMTFITYRGLYRFKRLPFGLASAPEIFQRAMDEILADCEGCYWYLDDVVIKGSTVEEHDARLNKV